MKAELTLPPELVNEIADKVIEKLKPLINNNGRQEDNVIFDVNGLTQYLNVSKQWIYESTHLKKIPHIKKQGLLRFRKKDIDKWLDSDKVPAINTPERILKAIKGRRPLPYKGSDRG